MAKRLNVLLYNGPGVSALQSQLLSVLKSHLSESFDVMYVDEQVINHQPWEETTSLLVIPGGQDLFYLKSLLEKGVHKINNFVANGGSYLGICAGAYFASDAIEFELNRHDYQVKGSRPLKFCNVMAVGSYAKQFQYGSEAGAVAQMVRYQDQQFPIYLNGGPFFKLNDQNTSVLATYPDGKAAIVFTKVGQGHVVLTGPHVEVDNEYLVNTMYQMKVTGNKEQDALKLADIYDQMKSTQDMRNQLLADIFSIMGLQSQLSHAELSPTPILVYGRDKQLLDGFKSALFVNDQGAFEDTENSWVMGDCQRSMIGIHFEPMAPSFFSPDVFFSCLSTGILGQVLLLGERVTSTQTLIDKLLN